MFIKNASIELARSDDTMTIIGLHPGTVQSRLSAPFSKNLKPEQLFTPEFSVSKMAEVLASVTSENSGKIYDYNFEEILP